MFRSASACWSTTADTSVSHCRSDVFFAAVSRADNSLSVRYGRPARYASCRARSPSLNTTRAQPNALRQRGPVPRPRVKTVVIPKLHPSSMTGHGHVTNTPTDTAFDTAFTHYAHLVFVTKDRHPVSTHGTRNR